jgi:3-hydroxyacyl-[acyl-carrier-protein] dehydratase
MPGFPLMPGVLLCEAAAQLAGFYARKYDILQAGDYLGFGGMNEVRFRAPVYPNSRLIICARAVKVKLKRMAHFEFQGFVEDTQVFNGSMIGVPISRG